MSNYSEQVIEHDGWGAHINQHFDLPAVQDYPEWILDPLSKNEWGAQGFVLWDRTIRLYVHLDAIIALDMLKDMREVNSWKTDGMLVGTPVLSSNPIKEIPEFRDILHTPYVRHHPEFTLSKPIRLAFEQAHKLFVFLERNEAILHEISKREAEANKGIMSNLFREIAELGRRARKKQLGQDNDVPENIQVFDLGDFQI